MHTRHSMDRATVHADDPELNAFPSCKQRLYPASGPSNRIVNERPEELLAQSITRGFGAEPIFCALK